VLIGVGSFRELGFGACTNESASLLAAINIVQFVVRAVALWIFWVHAFAACPSAGLVLPRYAAWVHGPKGVQFRLNVSDLRFDF